MFMFMKVCVTNALKIKIFDFKKIIFCYEILEECLGALVNKIIIIFYKKNSMKLLFS